jgi:hypothetical protein
MDLVDPDPRDKKKQEMKKNLHFTYTVNKVSGTSMKLLMTGTNICPVEKILTSNFDLKLVEKNCFTNLFLLAWERIRIDVWIQIRTEIKFWIRIEVNQYPQQWL